MKMTDYFRNVVPEKHPGIKLEWIQAVMNTPMSKSIQSDGRIVVWGKIPDAEDRILRVVLLEDDETIHNAFFDRSFLRKHNRGNTSQ